MSKYQRLADHLRSLTTNEWVASFSELERILGTPLPTSARNYPAWWANQTPPNGQTHGWADAGWETANLNLARERVTFVRRRTARDRSGAKPPASPARPRNAAATKPGIADSPYGWDMPEKVLVGVGFAWRPVGRVVADEKQRLVFPKTPPKPGLYRFTVLKAGKVARYIGESDNISRRFVGYRNPGEKTETNRRLNARFLADLAGGAEIAVAVATDGFHLNRGDGPAAPDLRVKSVRLLIESAALWSGAGENVESLNRTT